MGLGVLLGGLANYNFNGNSNDSSGNGYNGTDTAITYSLANGRFGQGAGFNGSSSRILVPAGARVGALSAFAIHVWFKTTFSGSQKFYSEARSTSGVPFCEIGQAVTTNYLNFFIRDDASNTASISSAVAVNDGKWHLATCVKAAANSRLLYLDGSLAGSSSVSLSTITLDTSYFGARSSNGTTSLWYTGSLGYSYRDATAWSAERIKKYYTWALGRQISVMG
jgi:hypothetical protein